MQRGQTYLVRNLDVQFDVGVHDGGVRDGGVVVVVHAVGLDGRPRHAAVGGAGEGGLSG